MSLSSLNSYQLQMLPSTVGLVCNSIHEILSKFISSSLKKILDNKFSLTFCPLSMQSIPKESNNSIVSHTSFLYYLNLLSLETNLDLTWDTTNLESPNNFNIFIPCLETNFRLSSKASYSTTL